jgi:isocitrate lyase
MPSCRDDKHSRWIAQEKLAFSTSITLPTYHTTALHMNDLAQGYFGEEGMLAYVKVFRDKKFAKELL